MKKTFNSEKYGTIQYEESFWTGNKHISINGKPMTKKTKVNFELTINDELVEAVIVGNMFNGMIMRVNDVRYDIYPPSTWYEYVLALSSLLHLYP